MAFRFKLRALGALALLTSLLPSLAHAMSCEISSVMGVAFGRYRSNTPEPLDGMGTVNVVCRGGFGGDMVIIDLGRGLSGSYFPRVMSGPSRLEYNLYLDPARSVIWGDGSSGTNQVIIQPSNGQIVPLQIYGRIPPGQQVRVGDYSDTVIMNLIF